MPGRHLILVVDDNQRFRQGAERALRAQGFEVLCAADGVEALEIVRDIRPDAVVTDLEMPGLDGLSFCRSLRELRAFDAVPLVLCTHSEVDDDRCRQARILVGLTVVHKPIEMHEIVALVEDLLEVEIVAIPGLRVTPNFDRARVNA